MTGQSVTVPSAGGRSSRGGGRSRAVLLLAGWVLATGVGVGCESQSWDTVASQAIPHGVVRVWAAGGMLRAGSNALLVDVVGPAAGDRMDPPRLVFEKAQAAAGYSLRAEAILRPAGRARFRGRVDFLESGTWTGRLEVDGETVSIDVSVE